MHLPVTQMASLRHTEFRECEDMGFLVGCCNHSNDFIPFFESHSTNTGSDSSLDLDSEAG